MQRVCGSLKSLTVQQPHGLGKKAVEESGCFGSDAPFPFFGQQGEQFMMRVSGVPENAVSSGQAALLHNILSGDGVLVIFSVVLTSLHRDLQTEALQPDSNEGGQHAPYGASVEGGEGWGLFLQ